MSLHRKLSEAMAAIDWMPKTGRNTQQNYAFVSVENIKDKVRTELARRGVMIYVSTKSLDRSEFVTKSLTTMHHIFVQGEVTFADADSGEMFTVEAAGEAMDSGDKALNKAQTAMVKYALINTFLIQTGDDPDQETPDNTRAPKRRPAATHADEPPAPAERPIPKSAPPKRTFEGMEGMVQCESRSPLSDDVQCRKEQGHAGLHRTENESWE